MTELTFEMWVAIQGPTSAAMFTALAFLFKCVINLKTRMAVQETETEHHNHKHNNKSE